MKLIGSTILVLAAVVSRAQVIDTYPFWDGNVTNAWTAVAQTFDAPGSTLSDYQFAIDGNPSGGTLNISLYDWIAGTGQTGAALYSTSVAWPTSTGDVVLSGINVALSTGSHYGMVVELGGAIDPSVHFMTNVTGSPTGYGYWSGDNGTTWGGIPGFSTEFRATFGSVPEPASFAVLGLGALALVRRRRKN
jgi:hypothetical protein